MIDLIKSETRRIIYGCMERHAKKNNINIDDVQLALGFVDGSNTYTVYENFDPKLSLDFLGVMGVKIDFRLYGEFVPPFIAKSIKRFASTYGFELNKVRVLCKPTVNEKGKPDVAFWLFNYTEFIRVIEFKELFREEDIELPKV